MRSDGILHGQALRGIQEEWQGVTRQTTNNHHASLPTHRFTHALGRFLRALRQPHLRRTNRANCAAVGRGGVSQAELDRDSWFESLHLDLIHNLRVINHSSNYRSAGGLRTQMAWECLPNLFRFILRVWQKAFVYSWFMGACSILARVC
jgi:hypothetical protein